jgi:hypothetical protein
MPEKPPEFLGTENVEWRWWEALWPDPAAVLVSVGLRRGMDTIMQAVQPIYEYTA